MQLASSILALLDQTTMWAFIAIAAITVVYSFLRPYKKKKQDPLDQMPGFASLAQQRSSEREMQNVLVELSEMARQISAQLDTRAKKLELLMKDADERISTLQKLMSASPAGVGSSSEPQVDPEHVRVYSLADRGIGVSDIARQLHRPRGEVELILALRPKEIRA